MQSTLDTEKLRKELHDGIGRILSNIAMLGFYGRMQEDPAASRETFSKIAELASEGIAGLRGLVNNLDSGESGGLDTLIGMPEQDPPVFDPINRRPSIRLAIVEDDQVTRDTLSLILTRSPAISACEAYVSAEDALASLSADCPDILLVDLELPGMSGIELIEKVKQEYPSIDIMVHTIFEDSPTVFAAIKAGASGPERLLSG